MLTERSSRNRLKLMEIDGKYHSRPRYTSLGTNPPQQKRPCHHFPDNTPFIGIHQRTPYLRWIPTVNGYRKCYRLRRRPITGTKTHPTQDGKVGRFLHVRWLQLLCRILGSTLYILCSPSPQFKLANQGK